MTISSKFFGKNGHKIDEILADPFEEYVHDLRTNGSLNETPEIDGEKKIVCILGYNCPDIKLLPATIFFLNFWCKMDVISTVEKVGSRGLKRFFGEVKDCRGYMMPLHNPIFRNLFWITHPTR